MLLYKSLFAITPKLQKHKHIGIKENAEILVQCYCISSNNSRPSIIASLEYPPPPPTPLAVFSSWSRQVEVQCDIKTDQWRINQGTKSGTLKKPCSVYLMWLFLDLMGKWNKIFRARLPVNNCWNNRLPRIIAFSRIIAPFLWEKRNNRPRLLFKKIRYSKLLYWINCILVPRALWGPEHEDQASLGTRGTQHLKY